MDPTASKPDDWDEEAPAQIVDTSAIKPSGWLDNEPETIPGKLNNHNQTCRQFANFTISTFTNKYFYLFVLDHIAYRWHKLFNNRSVKKCLNIIIYHLSNGQGFTIFWPSGIIPKP